VVGTQLLPLYTYTSLASTQLLPLYTQGVPETHPLPLYTSILGFLAIGGNVTVTVEKLQLLGVYFVLLLYSNLKSIDKVSTPFKDTLKVSSLWVCSELPLR